MKISYSAAGAIIFLALSSALAGEPLALPHTWKIDEVTEFSSNWGAVQKDGECVYRVAGPGNKVWLRVPNWWGGSVRPPKGKIYVIEVTFKDVLGVPVKVTAQGGVGSFNKRSELHSIGGLKDQKWKTAHVPASWDLLMLPKGSQAAEIGFETPKESQGVPVSQITVREAKLPEDRVRYEAESRAWVARVQAKKAKTAVMLTKDQVPDIPEKFKGKAMVPYARPSYLQIHPNSAPQAGEAGQPLKVTMALNEFEPAPFAIYAQEDLQDVDYTVTPLHNAAGEALQCEVAPLTIEYALYVNRKTKKVQWNAQRFWPNFPAQIKKRRSHWFYVVLKTLGKGKSKPGTYTASIKVASKKHEITIPLHVEVLPFALRTMKEAGLHMGGCCYGLLTDGELKTMAEHNHNMVNIWFTGARPDMKRVGDKIKLDYYYLDDFMKRAKEHGHERIVWFLGGGPTGYPTTLSLERTLYGVYYGDQEPYLKKQRTKEQRGKIQPEVRRLCKEWIQDVVAHAKENDWPELIFTPSDEPVCWGYTSPRPSRNEFAIGAGPWTRDHFKAVCALLHEAAPKNKVYISMHINTHKNVHGYKGRVGEVFIPDVDIVCSNAVGEDPNLHNKVMDAGKEWWQYGMQVSRRYGYGFFFGAWQSKGALCWAYNWCPRLDVSARKFSVYGWYSPFGTIVTPTFEDIKEGFDDRRYWATAEYWAKERGVDLGAMNDALRKDIFANRHNGKRDRDLVNGFWTDGKDPRKVDEWRRQLIKKILELTAQ